MSAPDSIFESLLIFGQVSQTSRPLAATASDHTVQSNLAAIKAMLHDLFRNEQRRLMGFNAAPELAFYHQVQDPAGGLVINSSFIRTVHVSVMHPPKFATDLIASVNGSPFLVMSLRQMGIWQYHVDMFFSNADQVVVRAVDDDLLPVTLSKQVVRVTVVSDNEDKS